MKGKGRSGEKVGKGESYRMKDPTWVKVDDRTITDVLVKVGKVRGPVQIKLPERLGPELEGRVFRVELVEDGLLLKDVTR